MLEPSEEVILRSAGFLLPGLTGGWLCKRRARNLCGLLIVQEFQEGPCVAAHS